jgi:FAD-dependent fumarate reductase
MTKSKLLLTLSVAALAAISGMLLQQLIKPAAISQFSRSIFSDKMSESVGKSVIVVGSGLAGLCAAFEASKAGATVYMLDREAKPGGNSIKASSGINGAGTRFQKTIGILKDDLFLDDSIRSAGSRFQRWKSEATFGIDREKLIRTMTSESANAVTWLSDEIEIDLSVVAPLGGHSIARTHRGSGRTPPGAAIVQGLMRNLEKRSNFKLMSSSEVTGLYKVESVVKGVEYIHGGEPKTLEGTVVFASGGFAGDASGLLARYRPDLKGIPSTNEARPGSHGLLAAVGAKMVDMDSVQIHPTGFVDPKSPTSMLKILAAEVLRGEGGILLSPNGKRFINEMETREHVSNAIMDLPPKVEGDAAIKQWDITLLLDPGACEAASTHIGFYVFKGLMQKKKIKDLDDSLIESIDKYAAAVQAGKDGEFGRTTFGHWKLKPGEANREEEICLGRVTPIVHFTMGGVAFNEKSQVLRPAEDGALMPVPGLFAAGEITGGIHGDNRLGGSSLLECVVFGRIAGAEAVKH